MKHKLVEHKTIKNVKPFNLRGEKPRRLKKWKKIKTKILPWFLHKKLDDVFNLAKGKIVIGDAQKWLVPTRIVYPKDCSKCVPWCWSSLTFHQWW
jgi:hypothetical protein